MQIESQIPIRSRATPRRFAGRLKAFYGAEFGTIGTHLPFFTVWLKAIGIDPSWIGVISAVPAVTRFTVLPLVTGSAERRYLLRGALIATAFLTAIGFSMTGLQTLPFAVFLAYAATACVWTPMVPLTDAYTLRGVARYGLDYGPLRMWGSAAFIVGALVCGVIGDLIAPAHLIWVIAGVAVVSALVSLGLQPMERPTVPRASVHGAKALLRDGGFVAVIVASALIQGSHAAYYTFASITWQGSGLGSLTIASLWTLGVLAEIAVFARSPRFTMRPAVMMGIGALIAVTRWSITAQQPPVAVLAVVQLSHGFTYGLTQVGTMTLLVRLVPAHLMARGQGYFAACSGLVSSCAAILSGLVYARYGQGVYYMMVAMALSGAILIWLARHRLADPHPHSVASGG